MKPTATTTLDQLLPLSRDEMQARLATVPGGELAALAAETLSRLQGLATSGEAADLRLSGRLGAALQALLTEGNRGRAIDATPSSGSTTVNAPPPAVLPLRRAAVAPAPAPATAQPDPTQRFGRIPLLPETAAPQWGREHGPALVCLPGDRPRLVLAMLDGTLLEVRLG